MLIKFPIFSSLISDYTFVTLLNIFDSVQTINLNNIFANVPAEFEYVVLTDKSIRSKGYELLKAFNFFIPFRKFISFVFSQRQSDQQQYNAMAQGSSCFKIYKKSLKR